MKIDKRTLIKHHFWIVLLVCLLLTIALPPLILVNVGAAVDKRNEETKGALSKISSQSKAKTKKDTREVEERTKDWVSNQDGLWKFNWEQQKDLFHWPPVSREHYAENTTNPVREIDDLPFMSPLNTQNFFADAFSKEYDKLYEHLKLLSLPISLGVASASGQLNNPKGPPSGPMIPGGPGFPGGRPGRGRPAGGSFDPDGGGRSATPREGIFHQISLPKDTELPDQEIWLATEDYWVQRELVASLRRANEDVCVLRDARSESEKKDSNSFRLRSRMWELKLTISPAGVNQKLELQLKNISARKLAINRVDFQLKLTEGDPLTVTFEEQYIAADQVVKKTVEVDTIKLTGKRLDSPYAWPGLVDETLPAEVQRQFPNLKMKLDPRFTPIKQLVALEMGEAARSSRSANKEMLKPRLWKERTADASGGSRFPGGKGFGSPGIKGPGSMPSPGGGSGGGGSGSRDQGDDGGSSTVEKYTNEGLEIYRYINVTDAVRRMPVALVYTVDQAYSQDVLVALANSKLRVQITQIHWQRTRDTVSPSLPSGYSPGSIVGGKGGRDAGDRPPFTPPGSLPGFPFGPGVPGSGYPGSDLDYQDDGTPPPLIEVGIYGIATLYERYPPILVGPQLGGKQK